MSQNKLPIFIPAFKFVLFVFKGFYVCHYFLKENYNLFVSFNANYSKLTPFKLKQFNKYILKTFSIHWMRVSFRGKGYRLRKFKGLNKVTLNFGHSHWAKLALDTSIYFFKKLRRQNYLCFMKNYNFYKNIKTDMKFFKSLNSYTKRGLRLKKQFIKKRFGKISQVVSSLH